MIADGILDRFPKPDVVLGQHVGPLPAGMIAYKTGTALAASDSLKLQLFGRGGHGSQPESTIDPVVMASNVVQRLQTIVSRELSPFEPAVVTVGYVHAGAKDNIIPDDAELGINVRTFNEEVRKKTLASITRIAQAESIASGADKEPAVTSLHTFPITVVDDGAMQAIAAVFRAHFGAERVVESPARLRAARISASLEPQPVFRPRSGSGADTSNSVLRKPPRPESRCRPTILRNLRRCWSPPSVLESRH